MYSEEDSLATTTSEEATSAYSELPAISAMPVTEEGQPPTQPTKPTPKHQFKGHESFVSVFLFLYDNAHIVSGSLDGTMRKWNCDTGLLVGEPWRGEGGRIWAIELSPDGKKIVCGREDGSVQRWKTDGKMIEGVWVGHSWDVRSLSWSPSGDNIASGSDDGTILVRKAESGEIEVGPIETEQQYVSALSYSPSGDRIASGGWQTICIWDTKTGELVVGPIEDWGNTMWSVVWSSDNTKLYSASNKFARVFDSNSGTELYRFKHNNLVNSVALSPKHNVLACVGYSGIAKLWDTESHNRFRQPFSQEDRKTLLCVSFSRDGRYIAYSGDDSNITLWMVKDIAPELPLPPPSCLNVYATNPLTDDLEGGEDPYSNFFQPYHASASSGPSPRSQRPHASSARRLWNFFIPSRHRPTARGSIAMQQHPKRSLFARHTGPQPVTVSAGRKKKRVYIVSPLVKTNLNAQIGQSSSVAQPASQPHSTPQPQAQMAIQQPTQEEDYGCWGNFCLALWCIPRRTRPCGDL